MGLWLLELGALRAEVRGAAADVAVEAAARNGLALLEPRGERALAGVVRLDALDSPLAGSGREDSGCGRLPDCGRARDAGGDGYAQDGFWIGSDHSAARRGSCRSARRDGRRRSGGVPDERHEESSEEQDCQKGGCLLEGPLADVPREPRTRRRGRRGGGRFRGIVVPRADSLHAAHGLLDGRGVLGIVELLPEGL